MSFDYQEIHDKQMRRLESGLLVPDPKLLFGGRYIGRILRAKGGVEEFEAKNLIVNQGLDAILGIMFTSVAQITAWYLAPFANNYTPQATDTAASIVASAGESIAYTSATRVAFSGVEGGQAVTNSASAASFTFNASVTVYGAFLTSAAAQSATTGTLFSAAQFGSPKNVGNGDQLLLTYQLSAASS